MLTVGVYLLAREWTSARTSKTNWFLLGLILGGVPFAKLQATPLALFLAAVGFAVLFARYRQKDIASAVAWCDALALCIGSLAVPVIMLGILAAAGGFEPFWKTYVLASGAYAGQETLWTRTRHVGFVLLAKSDFRAYFVSAVMAVILLFIAWWRRVSRLPCKLLWPVLVATALAALTLLSFFAAGKAYFHYTRLLVPSFGMLFGLALFAAKAMLAGETDPATKPAAFKRWLAAFAVLAIGFQAGKVALAVNERKIYIGPPPGMSLVSQAVRTLKRPGDTMSVWGWTPSYYVETGIMPGTRDAISYYIISSGPNQDYFKRRYLDDLRQSRPAFFVDAISADNFRWYWTLAETHESFPELAKFIDENYTLWRSFPSRDSTEPGQPVRVYVLKKRLADLPRPANPNSSE
jgi:hypothetical protein